MALTHSTAIRNGVANLVVDALDAGSGNPNGQLILQTAGDVEVATIDLGAPAFGNAASGIATANPVTADGSATGGTATKFKAVDRDGTTVFTGTFGTTGADLTGGSAIIAPGDVVDINDGELTYEAMP